MRSLAYDRDGGLRTHSRSHLRPRQVPPQKLLGVGLRCRIDQGYRFSEEPEVLLRQRAADASSAADPWILGKWYVWDGRPFLLSGRQTDGTTVKTTIGPGRRKAGLNEADPPACPACHSVVPWRAPLRRRRFAD